MKVTIDTVREAQRRLKNIVRRTDIIPCTIFNDKSDNEVYIKTENLQKTGSFKIRGAYNKIASLTDEERSRGVIAASAGNHAQGVALAAGVYKIASTIVMPEGAPLAKITTTKSYGSKVVLFGNVYDDAYEKALELQQETGAAFIHAFNDPEVISGQGTIGLEIIEDLPDADIIVVPIGGGGIASGIALAAKSLNPKVKVIGVEPSNAASMQASLRAKRIVTLANASTIADGIAVKTPGELTFQLCREFLDDIVTVEEDEIANTILTLLEKAKIISEGAGAAAVAAIAYNKIPVEGKKIVCVLSGGNIDVNMLSRIIDKGLVKAGRKVEMQTIVLDKPGQLNKLLECISLMGANVVSIHHDRARADVDLGHALVELELETQDQQHVYEILGALRQRGYKVIV